jgi:tetratricopeptide (TPR) repeat protein
VHNAIRNKLRVENTVRVRQLAEFSNLESMTKLKYYAGFTLKAKSADNNSNVLKIVTLVCTVLLFAVIIHCYSPATSVMGAIPNTSSATAQPSNTGAPKPSNDFLTSYHKGVALLNTGKYNESIPYFDKALAIDPKNFYALYDKGEALLNTGKYNESIAYFDKALTVVPTNTLALNGKKLDLEALQRTNATTTK